MVVETLMVFINSILSVPMRKLYETNASLVEVENERGYKSCMYLDI